MFGIDAQELLVIVIIAVLVIGPKDMPLAMRTAGRWIGKIRRVSNHFRAGLETMIREAEMEEMEKKWAEQNAKIMAEHPADAPPEMEPTGALPSRPQPDPAAGSSAESRTAPPPDKQD
ncbi:twin-arginine translocase subunit TatB [Altererythrobacter salegens]|uniref:Twin-arginine translocase subunit TatB n=1 Tax=Croceibacterium salegens TaxID=1737568 RepID=A0A6I4SQH2_9SPHN|nr:Sec-independent protein translocase protein TatB [Croceibacterium salegens]MXO58064.1 twin-arginine translocase subunit TatB [Croceibacterium salegens]